jgi:hypothetical protein
MYSASAWLLKSSGGVQIRTINEYKYMERGRELSALFLLIANTSTLWHLKRKTIWAAAKLPLEITAL